MLVYFTILASVVLFVSNLLFNVNVFYNLNNNTGTFILSLWKIPIFGGNITIKQNILVINRKKKSIKINLKLSKKQLTILKEFYKNISTKILIDYIDMDLLLCMENPFMCSIISGMVDICTDVFLSYFKINNFDTIINKNIATGFRQDIINLKFNSGIYISIADIIWTVIITLFTTRRINNEERRRKTKC